MNLNFKKFLVLLSSVVLVSCGGGGGGNSGDTITLKGALAGYEELKVCRGEVRKYPDGELSSIYGWSCDAESSFNPARVYVLIHRGAIPSQRLLVGYTLADQKGTTIGYFSSNAQTQARTIINETERYVEFNDVEIKGHHATRDIPRVDGINVVVSGKFYY